jgi:hypothetical protein
MASFAIEGQIDAVLAASCQEVEQRTFARHQHLEQMAAQAEPTAEERSFDLECESFSADLATISASVAPKLNKAGAEYIHASVETELFLQEQGLPRRPPYRRTLLDLAGWLAGAALSETMLTAGVYQQAVGWILALLFAALISVGVTGPALFAGLGVVAARHRLSGFYRWSGAALATFTTALLCGVILAGAHFREVVATTPRLVTTPRVLGRAVWDSLTSNPLGPLAEMMNWGLVAVAAVAALLVAWKTFHTFGYIGWRRLAIGEDEAEDLFDEVRQSAEDEAHAAMRGQQRAIAAKVRAARRQRGALRRVIALDRIVDSARLRALTFIEIESAGVKMLLQGNSTGFQPGRRGPVAIDRATPERERFDGQLQGWLEVHDQLIAARPAARTSLAERYVAFCNALQRATVRAAGAARQGRRAIAFDDREESDR